MITKASSVSEREEKLKKGLEEEVTKKNINDSKFRAVAQRMDYSGFHQMVLGANLRPTKSGEVFSITQEKKSVFNSSCKPLSETKSKKSDSDNLIIKWRRATAEEKLEMLTDLNHFEEEFQKFRDFSIFADIVNLCYHCEDLQFIKEVFTMITKIPDFKGCRKMLTRTEKEKIDQILEKIGEIEIKTFLS